MFTMRRKVSCREPEAVASFVNSHSSAKEYKSSKMKTAQIGVFVRCPLVHVRNIESYTVTI